MSMREATYYATVGTLPTATAIRCETATYAGDMHDLLDSMYQSCRATGQGGSMMRGYARDDMIQVIDHMRTCVDDYAERVKAMQVRENMLDMCEEHHAAINELLTEMHGMLP